ncbi:flagellar hook-length control protein FliK [Oceanicoccus sp. KOV_DT_Chl]|uniref:flagellar hook-length control protein FliK n=1 Tax=Oceanicoccus sp. KOV_DT_Chl TaxID=1904639 RepID=UPI000C7D183C|nr:flagellar hook-length control protein FliK [Oceanicoccus sp. KOV_DT_Chl]
MNSTGQGLSSNPLLGKVDLAASADRGKSLDASLAASKSLNNKDFSNIMGRQLSENNVPTTQAAAVVSSPASIPSIPIFAAHSPVTLFAAAGGKSLPVDGLGLPPELTTDIVSTAANAGMTVLGRANSSSDQGAATLSLQAATEPSALIATDENPLTGDEAVTPIAIAADDALDVDAASAVISSGGVPANTPQMTNGASKVGSQPANTASQGFAQPGSSGVMPSSVAGPVADISAAGASQGLLATPADISVTVAAATSPMSTTVAGGAEAAVVQTNNVLQQAGLAGAVAANSSNAFKAVMEQSTAGKLITESVAAAVSDDTIDSASPLRTDNTPAARAAAATSTVHTSVPVEVGKQGWSETVMQRVMWMSSQNVSKAEIALDPPELGPLQVRISSSGDQTSVVFTSSHGVVRDALDQGLPRLREMMESQGLDLADVDVSDQQAQQQRSGAEGSQTDGANNSSTADNLMATEEQVDDLSEQAVVISQSSLVDQYV